MLLFFFKHVFMQIFFVCRNSTFLCPSSTMRRRSPFTRTGPCACPSTTTSRWQQQPLLFENWNAWPTRTLLKETCVAAVSFYNNFLYPVYSFILKSSGCDCDLVNLLATLFHLTFIFNLSLYSHRIIISTTTSPLLSPLPPSWRRRSTGRGCTRRSRTAAGRPARRRAALLLPVLVLRVAQVLVSRLVGARVSSPTPATDRNQLVLEVNVGLFFIFSSHSPTLVEISPPCRRGINAGWIG